MKYGIKGAAKRILDPRKGVPKSQIPECVGNPKQKHRGPKRDVALRGFDDKWRCELCHKVHVELTYKESGDLSPEGIGNWQVTPKNVVNKRARDMAAIKKKYMPGGEYYDKPMVQEIGMLVNTENVREASHLARRMPQGHGESAKGYSNRVVQAYRDMVRERGRK